MARDWGGSLLRGNAQVHMEIKRRQFIILFISILYIGILV